MISQATKDRINSEVNENRELYEEHGCDDRFGYLESLADDYGIDITTVVELADVLGPEEDFDALVVACQDHG